MKRQKANPWRLESTLRARGFPSITAFHAVMEAKMGMTYYQTRRLVRGDFIYLPRLETIEIICSILQCSILDVIAIDYRVRPAFVAVPRVQRRLRKPPPSTPFGARSAPGDPGTIEPLDIDVAEAMMDHDDD